MEFANHILHHAGLSIPLATPVFRSGEPVSVTSLEDETDLLPHILAFIDDHKDQASSIAIIGRTEAECRHLHSRMISAIPECTLIEANQLEYAGGISILPVYLSKGLGLTPYCSSMWMSRELISLSYK